MKSTTMNSLTRRRRLAKMEGLEARQLLTCDLGVEPNLVADLDCDDTVGFSDFLLLSDSFGETVEPAGSAADLDNDGTVGFGDFSILSSNYGNRVADPTDSDVLLSYHDGYWVGQATIPGSPVPATFVNDIHVDTETGYVTVYAQVQVANTIVSPVQVGPGETGVLPDGSILAAHPNAVYLNGSGQELMEADGTGTWWVKHAVIAEEGYYNVEVEAEEYVEVYVEGELQEDGSIRVGGVEENTGAVGFNIREVNTDTDPDTYTITRYRPANIDPSAGPIDLTPVPDLARSHTMQRSAGVSPFDGTVYQDTEDPATSNRGQAYTELIAVTVNPTGGSVTTEVWGTQGTDTSPEAAALIDLETAAQQLGATRVILNGPRYLLADAGTLTSGEATIQTFGDLEMLRIGAIELDLASAPTSLESDPYVPQTVSRNTDTIYYAGSEIYQLTSPAGELYVMQSTGTEIENADLAGLGDRLTLPRGWVFEVITLEEPLRVTVSDGDTIDVLVDDLGNAYGHVGLVPDETVNDEVRVGYEILQVVSPNEIITWKNTEDMTQEEFDAIELPQGWFKNQPREASADGGTFASSPGAAPGEFVEAEHFGHDWRHVATIVEANIPLDDDALLTANTISKSHELTFDADTTLSILISPEDEHYVMVSRDAGRTSDTPTIPEGWQLVEHTLDEELVIQLPNPTLNIRADNEDSFQGPVPELAALIGEEEADSINGLRYCELIGVTLDGGTPSAEVWWTANPADCTPNVWDVDLDQAQEDLGALQVIKNGPRYFVMDASERIPDGTIPPMQEVAGIQMIRVASVEANPSQATQRTPYEAGLVDRSNVFTYDVGTEVYELTSNEGDVYIMQSYAQIVDPTLTAADLPGLGSRLELPEGWTYSSRVLEEPIVLTASEPIEVLQDELQNSYSKLSDGDDTTDPDGGTDGEHSTDCLDDPVIMTADDGTEFVRTPDACFADLPDWPYEPQYVEIDGLRQAYVDEGPEDGPVVLLLHGQPSWSYLYRDMIPVLADAGYRVIAMDHLGMGRSDKPIDIERYSFLDHNHRLEQFIAELELTDINLFAQDWGSLIGLRTAGLNPDLFATISIGNGSLPVFPEGENVQPPVENPDEIVDIPALYAQIPDQQVPFYDGCERLPLTGGPGVGNPGQGFGEDSDLSGFGYWMRYAMTGASFQPSGTLEALTWFDLTPEEEAAYDAPFPSRTYMAGPRVFPSLINDVPGATEDAWEGLSSFEKPFLTIWASNDPGFQGSCEAQQLLIDSVPGADGQPHTRVPEASHFLQDDQGEEIATRLVAFYEANGIEGAETATGTDAEILSAYLGAVDVLLTGRFEEISGAAQQPGDDGLPLVFSVQIDASTLSPDDFTITTESGAITTPTVATLEPAPESDESRTVLLTGSLGSADDMPVSVEVVGSVLSVDGEELQGLTSDVTTNEFGASLVLALVDPAETNAAGNETTPTRIQVTFDGGVSGAFGDELGVEELLAFRIIDENGDSHIPTGFEDLGDDDNHVVLLVPPGVIPASVTVQSNSLFDPTNQPNASSSVEVSDTIELDDEHAFALLDVLRERLADRPAERMENFFPMREGLRPGRPGPIGPRLIDAVFRSRLFG